MSKLKYVSSRLLLTMCSTGIHAQRADRNFGGDLPIRGKMKMNSKQSPLQTLWERRSCPPPFGTIRGRNSMTRDCHHPDKMCLYHPHLLTVQDENRRKRTNLNSLFELASMYPLCNAHVQKKWCHGNRCSLVLLVAPKIGFRRSKCEVTQKLQFRAPRVYSWRNFLVVLSRCISTCGHPNQLSKPCCFFPFALTISPPNNKSSLFL